MLLEPTKDNILCWMVGDLPAFIISKFLKEKYDCNLYGIIHSDKNVKSFRLPLDSVFESFTEIIPTAEDKEAQFLSLANLKLLEAA